MKKKEDSIYKVLALAISLPSSILGTFTGMYYLIDKKIISQNLGLAIGLGVIVLTLYLMVWYANRE